MRRLRISIATLIAAAVALGIFCHCTDDAPRDDAPCDPGPTVRGIDVSYHQDTIAWQSVRDAGIEFAFVRVSDGLTFADPKFSENWRGAQRAAILRGAYQYFRPDESAIAQADLMIAALRRDPGDLPPALDVETDGGLPPAQLVAAVRAWVDRVRAELGVEPIVYTGPEFWRERTGGADLARQPLWIAHYTQACPTVPPMWTAWTFWQHTDRGAVPGIAAPVDLDLFAGDRAALDEFARRSRPPAR